MKQLSLLLIVSAIVVSCEIDLTGGGRLYRLPDIFPDYIETTIPPNIAPISFRLRKGVDAYALFYTDTYDCLAYSRHGEALSPTRKEWKRLIETCGSSGYIKVGVVETSPIGGKMYEPFNIYVSADAIDPVIAYRLIEPGYELWHEMGIYQYDLRTGKQSPILENRTTGNNCMNCHSFRMQSPDSMLLHLRARYAGTLVAIDGEVEKLNTRTDSTISALVYPSWHPSGRFVAFSVNSTQQAYHTTDPNRVEVFDEASDVVVYDVERHEVVTAPPLFASDAFETFPTFSPDGTRMYFCSAEAKPMPASYDEVRYSLCSIAFDPATRSFGAEVDTLYNANTEGCSASFPRVSPDGRFLVYTLASYGNFSIWHKDADLHIIDLEKGVSRRFDELNSSDVESYHSWSSNGRWLVFSSRRLDGLYTRPYIAHIRPDGRADKPFPMPQRDPQHYDRLMKSYNIPEFIKDRVPDLRRRLAKTARNDAGKDINFVSR